MSALNVPEADIMRIGGWETDHLFYSSKKGRKGAVRKWHSFTIYSCDFQHITIYIVGMLLFPDSPFSIVFVSSETTLEYSPDCQNVSVIRIGYDNAGPLIGRMHNLSVSNINSHMA